MKGTRTVIKVNNFFSSLNAWHDGSSINLNYCWMLEQHMDLRISIHIHTHRVKLYLLFPISREHRVKNDFSFLPLSPPPVFRTFLHINITYIQHISIEIFDKLKGLDGVWWMSEEQHRLIYISTSVYGAPSEIAFFSIHPVVIKHTRNSLAIESSFAAFSLLVHFQKASLRKQFV